MRNQEFFLQTLSGEFDRFHNVIAALPADRLDYKHDEKSRSAGELAGHLIGHVEDLIELIDDGVINHRNQVAFGDLSSGLARFDKSYRELESKVKGIDDQTWGRSAKFLVGDHLVAEASTQDLMWLFFLDCVHHRGQLSTCIRPMGGKVPSIYGPSADTMVAH